VIGFNHITKQAVFKPNRNSVKGPWEQTSFGARTPIVPFQAPPKLIPGSPTPGDQSLIQGDDFLLRPRLHRQGQVEGLEPSTSKSQVPRARPPQEQPPAMPQETTGIMPAFAQTTESELALSLDRKPPHRQPIRYQISKNVDNYDGDTEAAHDHPSNPGDSHGRAAQTRLRFDKSVNTDTLCENTNERDSQELKSKRLALAVPKGIKGVFEYAVTGAAEGVDTFPQFLRDLSTGPERLEAPGIDRVMSCVTSTI